MATLITDGVCLYSFKCKLFEIVVLNNLYFDTKITALCDVDHAIWGKLDSPTI